MAIRLYRGDFFLGNGHRRQVQGAAEPLHQAAAVVERATEDHPPPVDAVAPGTPRHLKWIRR